MLIYFNASFFQFFTELYGTALSCKLRDDNASHIQTLFLKLSDQPDNIHIISNSKIPADFVLLYICCTDHDHDLCHIRKLHKHLEFTVRCKSRQYPRRMVIIK